MREIPVSSLGPDKVRVEAGETGGYVVTDSADGEIVGIVDPGIPTEALLAIVADRLREKVKAEKNDGGHDDIALDLVQSAVAWLTDDPPTLETDADQIGEGR